MKLVCEVDLHGHTKYSAFPSLITYSPEEAVIRAKEIGLKGLAITGHDTVKGLDEGLEAGVKYGVIVIPGIELTCKIGTKTPHVLALGITPEEVGRSRYAIPRYKDPLVVIAWIHDHGGIAIAAHPSKKWLQTSFSYKQVKQYHPVFDGIEVINAHGKNEQLEVMATELSIAGLGSSDFHSLDEIGLARTQVQGNIRDYQDIIRAIKENRVRAVFGI